jgi:predicted enzyme related to lactoylglutathione lyase
MTVVGRGTNGGMYLENLVVDAHDPRTLGRFWEALLGAGPTLTDEPDAFETRLTVPDGPVLDLCFQRVPEPVTPDPRLHLDLSGGARQAEVVQRALELGARHLDIGQRDVPWVVLADPEGNPFCVMEERPEYAVSGPIAALPLDSADPARDAAFWAELSGWQPVSSAMPAALRHPSGRGVLLELCPQPAPKATGAKNRLHLDLRLEREDDADAVAARVVELGGRALDPGWGELPWRVMADPSGNELCLLPAR